MLKPCVVLDGKIINIGEWDYQKRMIEISPVEYDQEGNLVKEAVFEEKINNPLPDGAVEEERDFEYSDNRGWYEVGAMLLPSDKERIQMLEETILSLMDIIMMGGM